MASQKKVAKKEVKKQDNIEDFIELARDLKEIVLDLNQRMSEMETMFKRIRTRLGL
tara:strand:- start:180 stop:347 length:168 start_codon:yes stop_codon:yes gene_type:complete